MSRAPLSPPEHIGYRRSPALPGLEFLDAYHSPREWRGVGYGYGFTTLRTWRGVAVHRGQRATITPGVAFCNYPDDAMIGTPEAGSAGTFHVLMLSTELLAEWAHENQVRSPRVEWRSLFPQVSEQLTAKLLRLSAALDLETSALHLQATAAELAEQLVRELVLGGTARVAPEGPALRGTARMRECLSEPGFDVDLASLAAEAGLGKFQALRAFKRRYGMPPHAYQLYLRISRARLMLRAGAAPADVAAHFGFVDQSHMNRHFKRIVGVTPRQYALGQACPRKSA